jgi:hypothetical protein
MKKQPLLLTSENDPVLFRINIRLQEGRTATFTYSDRVMAREHFEQLRFHGVVGGVAVREITFEQVTAGS